VPVVDAKGQLRHEGGVVDSPGLYALGLPDLPPIELEQAHYRQDTGLTEAGQSTKRVSALAGAIHLADVRSS